MDQFASFWGGDSAAGRNQADASEHLASGSKGDEPPNVFDWLVGLAAPLTSAGRTHQQDHATSPGDGVPEPIDDPKRGTSDGLSLSPAAHKNPTLEVTIEAAANLPVSQLCAPALCAHRYLLIGVLSIVFLLPRCCTPVPSDALCSGVAAGAGRGRLLRAGAGLARERVPGDRRDSLVEFPVVVASRTLSGKGERSHKRDVEIDLSGYKQSQRITQSDALH